MDILGGRVRFARIACAQLAFYVHCALRMCFVLGARLVWLWLWCRVNVACFISGPGLHLSANRRGSTWTGLAHVSVCSHKCQNSTAVWKTTCLTT